MTPALGRKCSRRYTDAANDRWCDITVCLAVGGCDTTGAGRTTRRRLKVRTACRKRPPPRCRPAASGGMHAVEVVASAACAGVLAVPLP
jgi:hypothetical protein